MDVTYINPFISATLNVFKTMMQVEVRAGQPALKAEPFPTYDISGIIGLSGEAQGSIALSFPKILALKVVSLMLGMEIKVVGPDLTDGVGELVNIVAGNAKQGLVKYNLTISLPNVVVGRSHVLSGPSATPTITVPFSSTIGTFAMEVSLKSKR